MKEINQLSKDLDEVWDKLVKNLMDAQEESAKKMWDEAVILAPMSKTNGGDYISSIQVSNTKYENDVISTSVYTDMKTEDGYFVGRMIENGTGIYALEDHIGKTKTFEESGYRYWYIPADKVNKPVGKLITIKGKEYYVGHAQPPKPHFKPALTKVRPEYKEAIRKAVKEAFK